MLSFLFEWENSFKNNFDVMSVQITSTERNLFSIGKFNVHRVPYIKNEMG